MLGKRLSPSASSGISLSSEGGAHQSTITLRIGIELPGLTYAEPDTDRQGEQSFPRGGGKLPERLLDANRQLVLNRTDLRVR
jgi:hypothetical protein